MYRCTDQSRRLAALLGLTYILLQIIANVCCRPLDLPKGQGQLRHLPLHSYYASKQSLTVHMFASAAAHPIVSGIEARGKACMFHTMKC